MFQFKILYPSCMFLAQTNSAYMLFYERVGEEGAKELATPTPVQEMAVTPPEYNFELSPELADWIWKDNTAFLRDKNIFCHNYFGWVEHETVKSSLFEPQAICDAH